MIVEFDKFIHTVIDDVYAIRINKVKLSMTRLVEELVQFSGIVITDDQIRLNDLMQKLILAVSNSDYRLYADILEFELLPIINKYDEVGNG